MHTIREYIEWIKRVRVFDPTCENLIQFHRKLREIGEERIEGEATSLERELFLPPNPFWRIQEFENLMGALLSEVDAPFFMNHASELGLLRVGSYVQGATAVSIYESGSSPGAILHIGQTVRNSSGYVPPREARFMKEGKWYSHQFDQSSVWICGQRRSCHDMAEPFLELVDTNGIPSAIVSREDYAGASNIPAEAWKVSE